jgi:hypothetical protein
MKWNEVRKQNRSELQKKGGFGVKFQRERDL